MIGTPKTGTLTHAVMSGVAHEGLTITTRDGRPALLAVVDEDGNIVEAGPGVEREAYNMSISIYRNFLAGKGHLRVYSVRADGDLGRPRADAGAARGGEFA